MGVGAEQKQGDWKTPCEAFPDQPGAGGSERCDVLVLLNRLFILLKLTPVSTENNPVKGWGWWGGGPATARISLGHGGGGSCPQLQPVWAMEEGGSHSQLQPAWAMGGSRTQLRPGWAMGE